MVQRLASTLTLAVIALKASSTLALPMVSEDATDLVERNIDDSMDFETRELGGSWLDGELIARKILPPKPAHGSSKPSPSLAEESGASSVPVESFGATLLPSTGSQAPSQAPGERSASSAGLPSASAAATSTEPMMSNAASETLHSGSVGGAKATKTVTHTVTAKPTPCGIVKKKKGKKVKGGGKQQGNNSSKRAVPIAATSHLPSGSTTINSAPLSHTTLAPSAGPSGSPSGHVKTTTKTMKGKDGTVTVMHIVHATPTGCVGKHKGPVLNKPNKHGPTEKGKGDKQKQNESHKKDAQPHGQQPRIGVVERGVYEIDELD